MGNFVLCCNWAQLHAAAPPEHTPMQPPLPQPSVPALPECQPTKQLPAILPQLEWPMTHDPTTPSAATTVPTDKRKSTSPRWSTNYQVQTGSTPTTKVQELCSLLGEHWKTRNSWKSTPFIASSIFFIIFLLFFSEIGGCHVISRFCFCFTGIWLFCNPTFPDEGVLQRVQ